MKTFTVPNMHCNMCVQRIENALKAEGIKSEICLEKKTVSVDEALAAKAAETLDDIGFDVE